jgi:hypothetical protein
MDSEPDLVDYQNNDSAFVASAMTDANGLYAIGDIGPGNYGVVPVPPNNSGYRLQLDKNRPTRPNSRWVTPQGNIRRISLLFRRPLPMGISSANSRSNLFTRISCERKRGNHNGLPLCTHMILSNQQEAYNLRQAILHPMIKYIKGGGVYWMRNDHKRIIGKAVGNSHGLAR